MTSRLSALLVWGLVVASAVFWGLRLTGKPAQVPAQAQVALPAGLPGGDLARLLGTAPTMASPSLPLPPSVAARFTLTGVVATSGASASAALTRPGVALLAVDGKPARAYRVGEALVDDLVLRAVTLRSARIAGPDGSEFVLELPRPSPAATGVPGSAVLPVGAVSVPPMTPAGPPPGLPQGNAAMTPPPGMAPPPMSPPMSPSVQPGQPPQGEPTR